MPHVKKNLGSAKDGTGHAIFLRLSSIALIPLCLWFAVDFIPLITAERETLLQWFENPLRFGLLMIFFVLATQHAVAGLQNVFDDYLHHPILKSVVVAMVRYCGMTMVVILAILCFRIHLGFVT